jgi:hypothetical protein
MTVDLEQRIREWFWTELNGDSALVGRMSEADLDRALTAYGIDVSVLVLSECRLKSIIEPLS